MTGSWLYVCLCMVRNAVLVVLADEDHVPAPPQLPESQLTSMIDTILTEEDRNNDGYISYVEFVQAQRGDASQQQQQQPPPPL